jgi:hypothetical protein
MSFVPTGGGVTGGVTGVTVPKLSDFEQLKSNNTKVAKNGIRVFILWFLGQRVAPSLRRSFTQFFMIYMKLTRIKKHVVELRA